MKNFFIIEVKSWKPQLVSLLLHLTSKKQITVPHLLCSDIVTLIINYLNTIMNLIVSLISTLFKI